jgi:molybdenum transport protein
MMYFSDAELDSFIEEDVPYDDLTTIVLGIGSCPGKITYETRADTVICGTEEAVRMFAKLGVRAGRAVPSGTHVKKGDVFLEGFGSADALHSAWKVCGRLLESACGVATRTRQFVELAKKANPDIVVATTRKSFPGTKKIVSKAIVAGGAVHHRLGLSETVLVFDEHIRFMGGLEKFSERIPAIKKSMPEKKLVVEAHDPATVARLVASGVDVVQCDKFTPDALREAVLVAKKNVSPVMIAAAGNVTIENIEAIAGTGVDFVVTSALYSGKPSDIGVRLVPECAP